jgi:hypothetical protein
MSDYIVTINSKPAYVRAFEYKGLLWNAETHRPWVNPEIWATCTDAERLSFENIISRTAESPLDLIKLAKIYVFGRDADNSLAGRMLRRSFFKKKFYDIAQIAKHPLVRKCGVKPPSDMPLPYKLAMGIYEFTSTEVRELAKKPAILLSLGKIDILHELGRGHLVERTKLRGLLTSAKAPIQEI